MLLDDMPVDFGVLLTAVTDEHEGEVIVERQHVPDQLLLVVLRRSRQRRTPGNAPLPEKKDGSDRMPVQVEEFLEHLIGAPWCARDVQERVAPLPDAPRCECL